MKTSLSLLGLLLLNLLSAQAQSPTPSPSASPATFPRERFQVFAANATKLKKFSDAVKAMKARPATDKTSWAYWANIHGVIGGSNPDWNQCRHAQWWFVAWHRAYVLELEHQLQAAINDPTFRLPYWDYLDAVQRKIPAAFRKTTSSLFESNRDSNEVGFETADLKKTFSASKFVGTIIGGGFGGASVPGGTVSGPFSKRGRMEQNPHNTVHVDIGGLMGDPRTAAEDPIFWVHHCNIDRIWEVWIKNGPHTNPPAGAFTTESFTFPGVNGQTVTHKVADMFDTKKLGYTYDRTNLQVQLASSPSPNAKAKATPENAAGNPPVVSETATPSESEPEKPHVLVASAPPDKPITITAQPQTVKVKPETVAPEHNVLARSANPKAAKKRVLLSLEGIEFSEPPKHLYKVYLNLPKANHKITSDHPLYVGTLAFFESPEGHHGNDGSERTEVFDITDTLASAKKSGAYDPNNLTVTIVPVGPPKDGKRAAPQNAKEITIKKINIKTTTE
jgi:tyrosinase